MARTSTLAGPLLRAQTHNRPLPRGKRAIAGSVGALDDDYRDEHSEQPEFPGPETRIPDRADSVAPVVDELRRMAAPVQRRRRTPAPRGPVVVAPLVVTPPLVQSRSSPRQPRSWSFHPRSTHCHGGPCRASSPGLHRPEPPRHPMPPRSGRLQRRLPRSDRAVLPGRPAPLRWGCPNRCRRRAPAAAEWSPTSYTTACCRAARPESVTNRILCGVLTQSDPVTSSPDRHLDC